MKWPEIQDVCNYFQGFIKINMQLRYTLIKHYVLVKPHHDWVGYSWYILHEAKYPTKGLYFWCYHWLIRVSTGCFWCTSTLYGLMYMLTVKPLSVLTLYGLGDRYYPCEMLDIPQQNPLKYGFSGIEVNIQLSQYT